MVFIIVIGIQLQAMFICELVRDYMTYCTGEIVYYWPSLANAKL